MPNNKKSYIRLFHAVPNAPSVDVFIDDELVAEDLMYSEFTPYFAVNAKDAMVTVVPSTNPEKIILQTDVTIPEDKILTVAVIDDDDNITLFPIEDEKLNLPRDQVGLRFVHLSPDAPAVDIRLPNGTPIFEDIEFKEVSQYRIVEPGRYRVDVYPTGTDTAVLMVPNIVLKPNRFYTVYAEGLVSGTPPLQVVIPLDGNSYLI